jgi:caa(3)-type oxidase subunit IV
MTEHDMTHHHPNYVAVWYWLVGLAILAVLVSALPVPHTFAMAVIFMAAVVKATLVALYYMHLRWEWVLLGSLVVVPLAFFAVLLLVLFADIAWH